MCEAHEGMLYYIKTIVTFHAISIEQTSFQIICNKIPLNNQKTCVYII